MNLRSQFGLVTLCTLVILLLVSCSKQTVVQYQCVDGSFVDSIDLCKSKSCPTSTCPELDCSGCAVKTEFKDRIVEKPVDVVRFQCADGSVKTDLRSCPSIPQSMKLSTQNTFQGTTDTLTEVFQLNSGLANFKANYKGSSNFQVYLIDESGNKHIVINEAGVYSGTSSETIAHPGYYRLQIDVGTEFTGDGFSNTAPWNIQIGQ